MKRKHSLVMVLLLLVLLLSSCNTKDIDFSATDFPQEQSESISSEIPSKNLDTFLMENVLNKYNQLSSSVTLTYSVRSNQVYFDCDDFNNTLLGYIIGDINNDGNNDILALTLEKHNIDFEEDGEDNLILFHKRPYIYKSGSFEEAPDWSVSLFAPYLSISNHISIKKVFSIIPNGQKMVLASSNTIYDDSSVYNDKYPPYYPPEDSLGTFSSSIELQEYKSGDFITTLGFQELISHTSGMPEAEHISYTDNLKNESLYCKGVYSVRTGSDMPTPEFETEDKGRFSNEQDALNVINRELSENGLSKYCLKSFSWNNKDTNSLILKENGLNTITVLVEGETIDNNKRCCHITIE